LVDYKNYFRYPFKAGNGTIVVEEAVFSADANFLPLETKLKSMDVDGVYFAAYGERSANMILQFRQGRPSDKVRFICTTTMDSQTFLSMTGATGEGSIAVSDYVPSVDRPLHKPLEAAHNARWGTEPDN
jgi:branched-chain amino acid transport system substrate-binding protein